MTEREMEDLIWSYPEKLLNEPLQQFRRQPRSGVGRADLVFTDRLGRLLVMELKHGRLQRGAIDQLHDYYGMLKREFPGKSVELMVIANNIPAERRIACEQYDIEAREISEQRFRSVAEEVGYVFSSEETRSLAPPGPQALGVAVGPATATPTHSVEWTTPASRAVDTGPDGFLLRCDEVGRKFFGRLFEKQKELAVITRITWNHESGFSLHFRVPKLGFVEFVWGFPATNREGRLRRQRVRFPFDLAHRRGIPEAFLNDFYGAISELPLLGGEKRPGIELSDLSDAQRDIVIEVICTYAKRASGLQV